MKIKENESNRRIIIIKESIQIQKTHNNFNRDRAAYNLPEGYRQIILESSSGKQTKRRNTGLSKRYVTDPDQVSLKKAADTQLKL